MLRISKLLFGALIATGVCQQASAFSIHGVPYTWQTSDMNYGVVVEPRNLGDEYRINSPIVTYGFDSSFLDYFGKEGVKAVDEAFRVYNRLPAVSKMTPNLTEFMVEGNTRENQRAAALFIMDMKSATMLCIAGYLGLAGEAHVYDLRSRVATPVTCEFTYQTIIRNFDPISWDPSIYVNGTQFTYYLIDDCTVADAIEEVVSTQVPAPSFASDVAVMVGVYNLGLTRDDAGGLRYLYRKSNYNNETIPVDAFVTATVDSPWNTVNSNTVVNIGGSSPWNVVNTSSNRTSVTIGSTRTTTATAGNIVSTNDYALRGGIEKVNFVRMNYDSYYGTNFRPVTLVYTIPTVKNNKPVYQKITRLVTTPDILITAADLLDADMNQFWTYIGSTAGAATATDVGPGIFDPRAQFTYNKVGRIYYNVGSANNAYFLPGAGGLREANATAYHVWGSFDGSTNAPLVFPSGTSIRSMEKEIFTDPGQASAIGQ